LLDELGRGGMGVVYKARQLAVGRVVALKMILSGELAAVHERERFRAEAEAVARLQHPNIVQLYEYGEAAGRPYFSLGFVGGGSLAGRLAGRPFRADHAAALVEALALAMDYAHRQGVIHRDLKPANVLIAGSGQRAAGSEKPADKTPLPSSLPPAARCPLPTPKITDFGLAKR